ncbi:GntR family transcriptional regulator [Frankia gtarii]|uniref:GntR family transcriptional regulator n=1 Tax=Frankia gtarii TaxID=2950102 RepID=UPI0021BE38D0|nr:GntR family transcriptional regulator [Frankia gtarii]
MERRSSGQQVAAYIRSLIFSGELRHDDHIRQDEIAETLGVSRIPVREAIIALEREGWVTMEPHRGAFVHGLDENSVRDQYALIGQLYGLAAQRATERGDDEGVSQLRSYQSALRTATKPAEFLRANEIYLRHIFGMANSPRLSSFSRLITGVVPGNFFELVPGTIENQKRGTAAVTRAIRAGEADRAFAEFVALLQRQGDRVVVLLEARKVLWQPSA